MRHRAAFLRTVLLGRPAMLLDEPFGALDGITRSDLQHWLLGVWEEVGSTVILITHDVAEAVYLADRVYVLSPRPGPGGDGAHGSSCHDRGRWTCSARRSSRPRRRACERRSGFTP